MFCRYRKQQGIDGPLFIGFDTHALSSPAFASALEVLAANEVTVMISENLVKDKGMNAGNIVRELAKEIKGGGGGQPFFATAGGSDVSGLDKALVRAKDFVNN